MLYCAEHENGGVISDCVEWGERRWMQTCGITKAEANSPCSLWKFDCSNLVIWGYPIEKEGEIAARREAGRLGGIKSGKVRRRIDSAQKEADLKAQLQGELERKEKEKEKEKGKYKGNTPCMNVRPAATQVTEHGKHTFILPQPELARHVDLSDERSLYCADVTSLACTICDLFPDSSGRSGPTAGKITLYLRTLASHKGGGTNGETAASEIVRPLLIQFWSEIKAGEDLRCRGAGLLARMKRLLDAHGCPTKT